MTTDEKKTLSVVIFIWILIAGIYLFPSNELAFSYYGMLGTLFALPFGMWGIWHFHRTWKPWVKPNHKQEDIDRGLIIAVIGSVLLPSLISTFASPGAKSFIMSFLALCTLMPVTYMMIKLIRHRPRR